jgi:hypothetical protein
VEIYIHALVALPPAEEQPVPRGQEVGWDPEPVSSRWRKEKSLPLPKSKPGQLSILSSWFGMF